VSLLLGLVTQVLHIALMLAAAPVLTGIVRWIEARLLGRVGASPLQPWRDLARLARKQPVLAENATLLFEAAPVVQFAAIGVAALLVPSFALGMASAPAADLLLIAGLLALARCTLALAGMDIGTGFGGIGASREMTFGVFAKPALLMVIFTLALLAGTTNLDTVAELLREGNSGPLVSLGLAAVALVAVALAETGRIPIDDPATRLELTMVHQATVLEYSGRDLALIDGAAMLKLLLWFTLIGTVFVPFGVAPAGAGPLAWLVGLVCWALKMGVLAVALAVIETALARMRVFRVPEFLGVALLLGLLAAVFLFVSQGFA
jgi:formate hydrogenlyase subunit 4